MWQISFGALSESTSSVVSNAEPHAPAPDREQSPSVRHAHVPIAGEAPHWDIGKLVAGFRIACTSDKSCGGRRGIVSLLLPLMHCGRHYQGLRDPCLQGVAM